MSKLRVAAYCRVSSDSDEQENSLELQTEYYKTLILHSRTNMTRQAKERQEFRRFQLAG